jgi:hypothetical protein
MLYFQYFMDFIWRTPSPPLNSIEPYIPVTCPSAKPRLEVPGSTIMAAGNPWFAIPFSGIRAWSAGLRADRRMMD